VSYNSWRGDAPARAKVVTLVVGSSTSGHTFTTTINGKSITVTAGGADTTSTLAAAIQAALSASQIPEFKDVNWTVDTATVTGTAATAGAPFTVSKSGTGTYTLTTVTTSSGPNHADEPLNWSLGTVPGAGDDVIVDVPVDLLYGWENVAAAAFSSLSIRARFEANLGLPRYNAAGYIEYRTRFWALATAVPVTIGEGDGRGPTRCNLQIATAASVVVLKTGQRQKPNEPAVNLTGAASGTLSVAAGDVGLATDDDTLACTITTAAVDGDATLTVGGGATVTTANQTGGTLVGYGTVTTLNITGGNAVLYKAPTTITADAPPDGGGAAAVDCRFTGTVTTVTARGQGPGQGSPAVLCGNNPRAKTFTNCTFTGGANLQDPDKSVTFTNAGTFDRASLKASDLGSRFTILRA
jgi:hypothetical protein